MIDQEKIDISQFTILVITFTIGSSILYIPAVLIDKAKQDAWISALLALVVGMLMVLLYNSLSKRFPDKNFAEYSEEILGKWLGKVVNFLFFFYFYTLSSQLLRDVGDFISVQVMPETPIQAIIVLLLVAVVIGVKYGLEVIARTAEFFFPWIIILSTFLFLSLMPKINLNKIQPMFEIGIKPLVSSSLALITVPMMQLLVFLMIIPNCNKREKVGNAFLLGTLIGGVYLIIITIMVILVLGINTTKDMYFPSYALAKKISLGHFLERLESIMAWIWIMTVSSKVIITFYASLLAFSKIFNLKDYKIIVLPLALILQVLAIIVYPNASYTIMFVSKIHFPYAATIGLIIPLLLLLVAKLRKKGITRYSINKR